VIEKHHDAKHRAQAEEDVGPFFVLFPDKNKGNKVGEKYKCHIDCCLVQNKFS
jgi:hypothetical protein